MKNMNQTSNIDRILDTSKIQLIDRLVLKNLKGGADACPPPTTDDF